MRLPFNGNPGGEAQGGDNRAFLGTRAGIKLEKQNGVHCKGVPLRSNFTVSHRQNLSSL